MRQEAETKTCPKCRLINPPEAERCDCGWDFVSDRQERSYLPKKTAPAAVGVGAGIVVVYILVKIAILVLHAAAGR